MDSMNGVMPDNAVDLQKKLPGVGRYTAGIYVMSSNIFKLKFSFSVILFE